MLAVNRLNLFCEPVVNAEIAENVFLFAENTLGIMRALAARGILRVAVAAAEVVIPRRSRVELAVLVVEENGGNIKIEGFEIFVEQV